MAHRRLALAALLFASVATLGCDPDAEDLRALDADALSERFACDDLTMVAASSDGSEALMLGIEDGLAAAALDSGEAIVADYALPDERLTVRWVSGSNVYQGHCGRDSGEAWELDERYDALAGEVRVRIQPRGDGTLEVTAELDELLLGDDPELWDADYVLSGARFDGLPVD